MKNEKRSVIRQLLLLLTAAALFACCSVAAHAAEYGTWEELQEAIVSGEERTFVLTQDVVAPASVTKPLTFSGGGEWVLDLNGHTLDRARTSEHETGQVILVDADTTLTVRDGSGTNSGRITGGFAKNNGAGIYVNGTLIFEGGAVADNRCGSSGGGIYSAGGSVTIAGGVIRGNTAGEYGGGIYVKDGSVTLTGGTVADNRCQRSGGGIHANHSKTSLTDAVIENNVAGTGGGGLVVTNHAECTLNAVTFRGNNAEKGGAVWLNDSSTLHARAVVVRENRASGKGGAFLVTDASGRVLSSEILYNDGESTNEGVICVQNGNLDTPDCRIISPVIVSSWNELKSAVGASAEEEIVVKLKGDVTAAASDSYIEITAGKNVRLDLAGQTLSRNLTKADYNGHVIVVRQGGVLTVADSSADNAGKITGGYAQNNGGGIYVIGTLDLTGGTVTGNRCGQFGAGIYVKGGAANISGGAVRKNAAGTKGGGIYCCENGTLNVTGGAVSENTATNDGGGIYVCENSVMKTSGGAVNGNTAQFGGGLYLKGANVDIRGLEISSNAASGEGAGAYFIDGGTGAIADTLFYDNDAGSQGGGVKVCDSAALTMTGCTFSENHCIQNGGAVYDNGKLTMTGCTVKDNKSKLGAIFAGENSSLTVETSEISGNSGEIGAGLGIFRASVKVRDTVFSGNKATEEGGAVYSTNSAFGSDVELTMENCTVKENSAKTGGGLSLYGSATLTGCKIENNTATEDGGGAFASVGLIGVTTETVRFNSTEFRNNTAKNGGGLNAKGSGAVLLHECTVNGNHAENNAGGVLVNSGVKMALLGADIQQNSAMKTCGGIMVVDTAVSMKGLVVIRNNGSYARYEEFDDLLLDGGAYVNSPGLYAGSYIHLGKDYIAGETVYAKDISKYQTKYFHIDSDHVRFAQTATVPTPIVASLFGGTAGALAIGIAVVLVGLGAVVLIRKKKTGPAQENPQEEEQKKGGEGSHDEED